MFNGSEYNGGSFWDLLSLFGIVLGYENLIENRKQSENNNVERHNQRQAKQILDDIHEQFEKQNKLLYYQNNLLEQILNILKGEK